MGTGFMFGMVTLGTVREFLGTGGLLGHDLIGTRPLLFFILPLAGFFCVGFIMAIFNYVEIVYKRMKRKRSIAQ